MAYSPDPDEWTLDAWKKQSFEEYGIQPHEQKTIETIRTNIKRKRYEQKNNCQKHLALLEDLLNKFMLVEQRERSLGKENWEVEQALKDLRKLQQSLIKLCDSLPD